MRVQQRPFDLGTPVTVISMVLVELWVGGGQMKRTEMSINRGWINKLCDTQRTKNCTAVKVNRSYSSRINMSESQKQH